MPCSGFDVLLSSYADGETSPAETRRVEGHIGSCLACRTRLAAILKSKEVLRGVPVPDAPADLKASLMAAAAEADARLASGDAPSLVRERLSAVWEALTPRYGFAFGLAAFLVAGIWLGRREEEPVPIDLMLSAHRGYALAQPLAKSDAPPAAPEPGDVPDEDESGD